MADTGEQEKKKADGMFRAAWLLQFVRVYVFYEETVRIRIKLLFFTVMDTAKEKKGRRREKKSKGKRKEEKRKEERDEKTAQDEAGSAEGSKAIPEDGAESIETDESTFAEKEKKGIKRRICNILQTIRNFCDKLKRTKEKAGRMRELWNAEHMAGSRRLLGREIRYLLKHSRPGKLKGYLRFGFDDPSATGYAMALYYGVIYPLWFPKLSVEPDFEKRVLDCRVRIRGKIRVWHFLKSGCRLFFSKDIRHAMDDIMKL